MNLQGSVRFEKHTICITLKNRKTNAGFQIDALSAIPYWLIFKKHRVGLIGPTELTSQLRFGNPSKRTRKITALSRIGGAK